MFKSVDVYEYGTGELLFKASQSRHLNGYNVVSACINRDTGRLELIVKRAQNIAYLKDDYACYRAGYVKHHGRVLMPDEMVIINKRPMKQDYAILYAFGRTTCNKICKVVHINGDEGDNRLDNLREGADDETWEAYNKVIEEE